MNYRLMLFILGIIVKFTYKKYIFCDYTMSYIFLQYITTNRNQSQPNESTLFLLRS